MLGKPFGRVRNPVVAHHIGAYGNLIFSQQLLPRYFASLQTQIRHLAADRLVYQPIMVTTLRQRRLLHVVDIDQALMVFGYVYRVHCIFKHRMAAEIDVLQLLHCIRIDC